MSSATTKSVSFVEKKDVTPLVVISAITTDPKPKNPSAKPKCSNDAPTWSLRKCEHSFRSNKGRHKSVVVYTFDWKTGLVRYGSSTFTKDFSNETFDPKKIRETALRRLRGEDKLYKPYLMEVDLKDLDKFEKKADKWRFIEREINYDRYSRRKPVRPRAY